MTTRVYLGHLARDASDRDVEGLFKNYGRIREVTLKNGFGFVEFADAKDADDAVFDFHGKEFMGERLVVELARGDRRRDERRDDREDRRFAPPERTEFRLIVENLAHGVSWQDIKDLMRKAGEVTFADLSKERDDEGVVEFSSEKDVQNALKSLDGENLRGKPITLRPFDPARDSVPRDVGRGSGRDRDRYDGRDRDRHNRDRFDGRDDRDRRDNRDRGDRDRRRSRSRSRDRGGAGGARGVGGGAARRSSRSRERGGAGGERDRRRSRSRDRGGRSDRGDRGDRERESERERDRGRASTGERERARRPSRSPLPRSKSPVARRGRSRSASRD